MVFASLAHCVSFCQKVYSFQCDFCFLLPQSWGGRDERNANWPRAYFNHFCCAMEEKKCSIPLGVGSIHSTPFILSHHEGQGECVPAEGEIMFALHVIVSIIIMLGCPAVLTEVEKII